MQIYQEIVTVLPDPAAGEVNIVMAGLRIALTAEETSLLADRLVTSLGLIRAAANSEVTKPYVSPLVASTTTEPELKQLRARAVIQAGIRDKGLSVRDDHSVREDQKV